MSERRTFNHITFYYSIDIARENSDEVEEAWQNTYDFSLMKFSFILDDLSLGDHKQNAYMSRATAQEDAKADRQMGETTTRIMSACYCDSFDNYFSGVCDKGTIFIVTLRGG
jgi:hypothetical protein